MQQPQPGYLILTEGTVGSCRLLTLRVPQKKQRIA
jgi:hypothetical protein